MAFLYSSPQIGTMQSPIQLYMDASGTCGYGAYTWMGPGSEATAHTSASRAGRALEGCLRHLLHRAVAPSTPIPYRAGIRKYYAFCHKFNLHDHSAKKSSTPSTFLLGISVKRGVKKDHLWDREVSLSKWACLPLLTSCLEG